MLRRFVLLVASLATFFAFAQPAPDPVPLARKALDLLLAGQYHELHAMFNKQMLDAASEDMLAQIGDQIKSWGKVEKIGDPTVQRVQNVDAVIFPMHFSSKDVSIIIPIDSDGKVAGLRFGGPPPAQKKDVQWTAPPYVKPDAFHEQNVTIGMAPWKLPGTLSVPNGSGPFSRGRAGAWFGPARS